MPNLTFEQACENHKEALDNFNADDLRTILDFSMACLYKTEAQILEDGGEVNYHLPAYRWNIEQAVINRDMSVHTMASAASDYVSNLQKTLIQESGLAK